MSKDICIQMFYNVFNFNYFVLLLNSGFNSKHSANYFFVNAEIQTSIKFSKGKPSIKKNIFM